jgi:1,4-dihydroxy-2-naphthoyl-CoA hydrolase
VFKSKPDIGKLNAHSRGTLAESLGIEFTEAGADFLRGRMPVDQRTKQPYGLLHGGASVALAETLGSAAGNLCLDGDRSVAVGLEISANHLRPATQGWVIGTARAIHIGRSTQVWDIRIEDEAGHMTCISRLTLAVVPKQ